MKKRFFLVGLIFALSAFVSQAQIYQMYSQDFETGTPQTYTSSSSTQVTLQNTIVSGGSRALKITHTQSSEQWIELDTIDFSGISTLQYYTLEFMHIAFISPNSVNSSLRGEVAAIQVKRPDQATWTQLGSTQYNMDDQGSARFASNSCFHQKIYEDWQGSATVSNTMWKKERFDLEMFLISPAQTDKKTPNPFPFMPKG
jgi:hypothetical protein